MGGWEYTYKNKNWDTWDKLKVAHEHFKEDCTIVPVEIKWDWLV